MYCIGECRPEERVISPQLACTVGSLLSQGVVDNYALIAPLRSTASLKGCKTIYRVGVGKRKAERLIVIDINVAVQRRRDFALNRHLFKTPHGALKIL